MNTFVILSTFIICNWNTKKRRNWQNIPRLSRWLSLKFIWCRNCLRMNFADCWTNELEFRICKNCEKMFDTEFANRLKKMPTFIVNVC